MALAMADTHAWHAFFHTLTGNRSCKEQDLERRRWAARDAAAAAGRGRTACFARPVSLSQVS
jgi:hypothetical protein